MRATDRVRIGLAFLIFTIGSVAKGETESIQGFYPLWEDSSFQVRKQGIFLGTNGAQYGVSDRIALGTDPLALINRTPNGRLKTSLYSSEKIRVTSQSSVYILLPYASRAFLSQLYSSKLDNPDFSLPVSVSQLSLGFPLAGWLTLTTTSSLMSVIGSGPIQTTLTPGQSLIAVLHGTKNHSISIHAGNVGLWSSRFSYYGAAYRYASSLLEAQLGYFYRHSRAGIESAPLLSLGMWL